MELGTGWVWKYLPREIPGLLSQGAGFGARPEEIKKFSKDEAVEFEKKLAAVKKMENIERAVGFIFSRSGFTKEAEDYCKGKGLACSDDGRWLETGKLKPPVV